MVLKSALILPNFSFVLATKRERDIVVYMTEHDSETPPPSIRTEGEPDFSGWNGSGPRLHERRRQFIGRALRFGESGWDTYELQIGAEGFPNERHQDVIAFSTLLTQCYLVVDFDRPYIVHVTDAGKEWFNQVMDQTVIIPEPAKQAS